jgi:hypothetical protein
MIERGNRFDRPPHHDERVLAGHRTRRCRSQVSPAVRGNAIRTQSVRSRLLPRLVLWSKSLTYANAVNGNLIGVTAIEKVIFDEALECEAFAEASRAFAAKQEPNFHRVAR